MLLYIVGPVVGVGLVVLVVVLIKRGSFDFRNDYYKLTGNFLAIFNINFVQQGREFDFIKR